jgi:hypothetical protein
MKLPVEESSFNYLLFYEVQPDRLRLLRILHGFRDLQAELGK